MSDILNKILAVKAEEVSAARSIVSLAQLEQAGRIGEGLQCVSVRAGFGRSGVGGRARGDAAAVAPVAATSTAAATAGSRRRGN